MGIYYKPGSLKAKLCVEGAELIYKYLDEKKIPYRRCGKVIVAVNDEEIPRLKKIYMRACANKCKDVKMIDREELLKIEPHCTVSLMLSLLLLLLFHYCYIMYDYNTIYLRGVRWRCILHILALWTGVR